MIVPDWKSCGDCGTLLLSPHVVDYHIVEEVSNPSPKKVIDFLDFGGECTACGAYNAGVHKWDRPSIGRFGKERLCSNDPSQVRGEAVLRQDWSRL